MAVSTSKTKPVFENVDFFRVDKRQQFFDRRRILFHPIALLLNVRPTRRHFIVENAVQHLDVARRIVDRQLSATFVAEEIQAGF